MLGWPYLGQFEKKKSSRSDPDLLSPTIIQHYANPFVLNDPMGSFLVMDLEDHITTTTKEKKTNSFMSVRQKSLFMTNSLISLVLCRFLVGLMVQKMCAIPTNVRTDHFFVAFQLRRQLPLLHAR